ncbi:MAG: 50S ribosomal protein L32e, partial [Aigarchaeota archaeon]|nr:50S ribosomal protein L32e [Aigarchaeota archaeon]
MSEEQRQARPKAAVKVPKRVLRARKERPEFQRQESWRYGRLETGWRRPRGKDSKMRLQARGWPALVKVGYRSPRRYRGLHPSGFVEVLVHNVGELEGLDPEVHAVRIAGNVGRRKAIAINEAAVAKGLRVL